MQRLRRLASRRAARWETGRFVAEGPKLVDEAVRAGAGVETVYLDGREAGTVHRDLAERAHAKGAEVVEVEPGVLQRACDAVTPQPIAAVVAMLHVPLATVPTTELLVVCVGLQDPGNAGTVVRSASASGSGAVIFCAGAVDIYNPKAVRASAGAVFHLPLVVGGAPGDLLDQLGEQGVTRLASVARGGQAHDLVDWTAPSALVLGSESHGLPEELDDRVDGLVTVPMQRSVESLNVAMAATVLCFEAARQRRATRGAA